MVYLRIFEGCNLFCEHCFIPSNPKKIDINFFEDNNLGKTLKNNSNIKLGDRVYLQWHGGEPTLLGYEYINSAIKFIEQDKEFTWQHGIQTNLMNFHLDTNHWVNLYKTYFNSSIGVSWDYGIRHIKTRHKNDNDTNEIFEEQFWQNVRLAIQKDISLYLVVTVTKKFFKHFKNPLDFFNFMEEKGITKVNLERITKTGYARNFWEELGLTNLEYSTYMSKFYRAYILYKENNLYSELSVSPFDGLLQSVIRLKVDNDNGEKDSAKNKIETNITQFDENSHMLHQEYRKNYNVWDVLSYKNQGYGCWSGECDTKFHTIDANGYKHGCTAINSELDNSNKDLASNFSGKIIWLNKSHKNIGVGKDSDIKNKEGKIKEELKFAKLQDIISSRIKRQDVCEGCEFLSICSSGCLSLEKIDQSLECSGAKKLFTTIYNSI